MYPNFFDTHAHLDHRQFASDLDAVIARAAAAGISRILTIGTDLESSRRSVALAEANPGVYAVVGVHPCDVDAAPDDVRPALRDLAIHPKVVAIGETGLDHYHRPEGVEAGSLAEREHRERQVGLFEQHLEVAAETGLGCVVHQRNSLAAVLEVVRPWAGRVRTQFHCFVDDPEAMRTVLALGGLVSFTGILTFKNGTGVRETLAATPADRFMLETDSPYLAPVPYRGKRCEPAYVRETALAAAQTRGISVEELSELTCANARRFFPKLQ